MLKIFWCRVFFSEFLVKIEIENLSKKTAFSLFYAPRRVK
ncbi:hypothetical protein B4096_2963 [Heyndrickxia coagulans]|nr:hypothetical protein B4096_2963 [Heyndrickxia coagulans]